MIFNKDSVLYKVNLKFIQGLDMNILPTTRRASHNTAIKVMDGNTSYMELEILLNLDHQPTFDEIMNNATVKNGNKDKTVYNALVGFEYHYYDIIINYINNKDTASEKLLRDAAKEYVNKLKKNPSLSQIKKFKPTVKLPVIESIDIESDDYEYEILDDYYDK